MDPEFTPQNVSLIVGGLLCLILGRWLKKGS